MSGCRNSTMSTVTPGCVDVTSNVTVPYTAVPVDNSTNALLYIVCVLSFYAFSIVVLMIKYVRREKEEANQRNFFNEFVNRENFSNAQYQNRMLMQKLLNENKSKFPNGEKWAPNVEFERDNVSDCSRAEGSISISIESKTFETV